MPATQNAIGTSRDCQVFVSILISKCVQTFSDHSHVQFFDILTSKGAPTLKCFDTFDFQNYSKRASPHNRVKNFGLYFCLRTCCRFTEPTFRPSRSTKLRKHSISHHGYPSPACLCLLTSLLSDISSTGLPAATSIRRKFDFQTSFDYLSVHEFP